MGSSSVLCGFCFGVEFGLRFNFVWALCWLLAILFRLCLVLFGSYLFFIRFLCLVSIGVVLGFYSVCT